ncbi:hypothetical protein H257_17537 [Aphanomyces astaci]|uniref:Uncharacterized protein n=2 Tax=Aphanomyces astaci TaxID=112090 RepID=W4FEH6_APHAT|nr:hypothetical protein H257_17537 [Aphanomyces astaci]ETV65902.1 hypothetical protein H257_17537 [Aphanomyces astaci]|eukprot:XP_009844655.1 hypothetical protein H257_17537 [Aphanomyces astaci]
MQASDAPLPGPNMKNTRKISPELAPPAHDKPATSNNPSTNAILELTRKGSGIKRQGTTRLGPPPSALQRRAMGVLESQLFSGLMNIITIYCLVGDDLRVVVATKSMDIGFYVVAFIFFCLFCVEFLLSCFAKPLYIGSFYFYLDIVATISLIPDIGFIWDLIVGSDTRNVAALSAGKTGRIVRVVRIVRLIRIVKLIKWRHNEEQKQQVAESKTGGRLAEMTTRRVVMIVIFLCFVLPAFDGGYNDPINSFETKGFESLHVFNFQPMPCVEFIGMLNIWVTRTTNDLMYLRMSTIPFDTTTQWLSKVRFSSLDLKVANLTSDPTTGWSPAKMHLSEDDVLLNYRVTDLRVIRVTGCYSTEVNPVASANGNCTSIAYFDIQDDIKAAAKASMIKSVFVMFVLIASSISFVRVARKIVLDPIERMMATVHRLELNPLAKHTTVEQDDQKLAKEQGFETALLESTLEKISALMQVGFGAAGADIIGKNMGAGEVDPMLPGKKITSIYGFCDIRQFTDTTECLQEEVMVYVNKLGHIMHSGTHAYYGMANKNVGDAFLLSWKLCDGEMAGFARFSDTPTEEDRKAVNSTVKCPPNSGAGRKMRRLTPTELADSALTAFLKCMIDLDNANSFGVLHEYIIKDVVIKRFGPGFRIQMGFGMHVGWAIEGAIGSRFKIDATYISPHVEMADRLEAGSKIFKTKINVSHWLYALLSPAARKFMRKMDTIQIRGVDTPLTVYTFDVTNPKNGFATPKFDTDERGNQVQKAVDFEHDPEYKEIREGLDPEFLESAAAGVDQYLAGDWAGARGALTHALQLRPTDGPCKYVMDFLKEHDFQAPPDWKGVRTLNGY